VDNWHVLDLEKDPVPGDATRVRALAAGLRRQAELAREHSKRLGELADGHEQLKMRGDYAPEYLRVLLSLPPGAAGLHGAYSACGDALSGYANDLALAQGNARAALARGEQADAGYRAALNQFRSVVPVGVTGPGVWRGLDERTALAYSQGLPVGQREYALGLGRYAGQQEEVRQQARKAVLRAAEVHQAAVRTCVGKIQDCLAKLRHGVGDVIGDALRGLGDTVDNALDVAGDVANKALDAGGDVAGTALGRLGALTGIDALSTLGDQITDTMDDAGDTADDAADETGDEASDTADDVADEVDPDENDDDSDDSHGEEPGEEETDDGPSEWDNVEENRDQVPDRETINADERRDHILDGDEFDPESGGHRYGTRRPNKTEFPERWDDDDAIIERIEDVAKNPDQPPRQGPNGNWVAQGTRDGVRMKVIIRPDGTIRTAHPTSGDGVVKNDRYGNPHPKPFEF